MVFANAFFLFQCVFNGRAFQRAPFKRRNALDARYHFAIRAFSSSVVLLDGKSSGNRWNGLRVTNVFLDIGRIGQFLGLQLLAVAAFSLV